MYGRTHSYGSFLLSWKEKKNSEEINSIKTKKLKERASKRKKKMQMIMQIHTYVENRALVGRGR